MSDNQTHFTFLGGPWGGRAEAIEPAAPDYFVYSFPQMPPIGGDAPIPDHPIAITKHHYRREESMGDGQRVGPDVYRYVGVVPE